MRFFVDNNLSATTESDTGRQKRQRSGNTG